MNKIFVEQHTILVEKIINVQKLFTNIVEKSKRIYFINNYLWKEGNKYEIRRTKCKPYGKAANASLVSYIQEKLNAHWSPEQISGRIELESNKQVISFSTIYSWLYKGILKQCSVKLLRRKGKSLKPKETRGKFNIGKTISKRPKKRHINI